MPATATSSTSTGNAYIDGILMGQKWATLNLTYSFPTSGSFYGSGYGSSEPNSGFGAFSAAQQNATKAVLAMYANVSNLTFSQTTESAASHADLRFAVSSKPSTAWAYGPGGNEGGDVWFGRGSNLTTPTKGTYAFLTLIHETGHALGLDHAHQGRRDSGGAGFDGIHGDELPQLCRRLANRRIRQREFRLCPIADDVRHRRDPAPLRRRFHHQCEQHRLQVERRDRRDDAQRRQPGRAGRQQGLSDGLGRRRCRYLRSRQLHQRDDDRPAPRRLDGHIIGATRKASLRRLESRGRQRGECAAVQGRPPLPDRECERGGRERHDHRQCRRERPQRQWRKRSPLRHGGERHPRRRARL